MEIINLLDNFPKEFADRFNQTMTDIDTHNAYKVDGVVVKSIEGPKVSLGLWKGEEEIAEVRTYVYPDRLATKVYMRGFRRETDAFVLGFTQNWHNVLGLMKDLVSLAKEVSL
jgi:hypothetical protein